MGFNTESPFSVMLPLTMLASRMESVHPHMPISWAIPELELWKIPRTQILGRLFYNAAAYAAPRGLTFGDSDRNSLRNPDYINFNMALFKHFVIKESTALEFRAEGFNVFNHTEWLPVAGNAGSGAGIDGSGNNALGGTSFLYSGGVHQARILQFALKFLF